MPNPDAAELDFDVLVVGAGVGGLAMGVALKRHGGYSFAILEAAAKVGGTWRDNRYPGCGCDVPSHLYSFSFAPNPDWTRAFASQGQIQAYLEHTAREEDLLRHLRFGCAVTSAVFDEASGTWEVEVDGGDRALRCRALISALGALNRPAYPHIPGLESFEGRCFHSQQWDHGCALEGKRVAVVGTGASAIQFVPEIAKAARQLYVFQRTPPWVLPKPDRRFTRVEKWLFRHVPKAQRAFRAFIYWRLEARVLPFVRAPRLTWTAELVGRLHLRRQVRDRALRAKLLPGHRLGCKRILISNDYYRALVRDDVELVPDPIVGIDGDAVETAGGERREVDVLIFGTGFRTTDLWTPLRILGRGGLDINQAWSDGMRAYLGTTVAGFPNLFVLFGPNTGLGHTSQIYMLEAQADYVLRCLDTLRERRARWMDVRPEVQARFNDELHERLRGSIWDAGCTSWYLDERGCNRMLWPDFTFRFRQALEAAGGAAFELPPAPAREAAA